ncbi:DUF5682 family protein [Streptomyces sp. NPDC059578]|uniref:DUF5682 family protein n=1 Tax=unclassified Streptomyces TaxID=2593676 RepID=UPI003655A8E8
MTGRAGPGRAGPGPLLLGVRHHGPGSARAVAAALDAAGPRAVLIEGPPEADALLPLAADPAMRPPVALLAHVLDGPGPSASSAPAVSYACWPFADFSPEWVALRWALRHGVPVRFIDLPAAHSLARAVPDADAPEGAPAPQHADPLAVLAGLAGYEDPEHWWEDVVEHRGTTATDQSTLSDSSDPLAPFAPFEALAEAMTALREAPPYADTTGTDPGHVDDWDLIREAHMRLRLRAARREFGDDVAVVCGAWHVPALGARVAVSADRARLRGLPKVKAELTWVPWTHRRLAQAGGYGAGIESPGWYGHLFRCVDRPVERWLIEVAGLLRDEGRTVSPAHVIEAVRLAGTLAALRGRPLPGLPETLDAVRAVMCEGSDVPLALVHDRLVVGDVLGRVPDGTPAVPLQRDLTRLQRRLRLTPEAGDRERHLDLRNETDAARSRLLHRLRLLGVAWGEPSDAPGSTGTFREGWRLRWEPELSVRVAEAGVWGTTVHAAATARARADAVSAGHLADVTALAERCLLAGLGDALPVVVRVLADRAALDTDVGRLAVALPALVRSVRYGDVRGTGTGALRKVAEGLADRICVGLPSACASLDEEAAARMCGQLEAVHGAVRLLAETAETGATAEAAGAPDTAAPARGPLPRWYAVLRVLADRDTVSATVRGRAARVLLDDGELPEDGAARLMGLALSPGTPPREAAAWLDGFLGQGPDGGLLLVHDQRLRNLVDGWLCAVPEGAFTDVLPLLRRTFSGYGPAIRRTLGELVRGRPRAGETTAGPDGFGPETDRARSAAVLPVLALLLGAPAPATPPGPTGDRSTAPHPKAAPHPETAPHSEEAPA